jgi:hypothetical protein
VRLALDTNVISAIWSAEASAPRLLQQLGEAMNWGGLVVCPIVYAELYGYPNMTRAKINEFLNSTRVRVDWEIDRELWDIAGERFAKYGQRRRKQKLETPKRFLADFLIGAHAALRADRLLTLDQRRYRHDFPELHLL